MSQNLVTLIPEANVFVHEGPRPLSICSICHGRGIKDSTRSRDDTGINLQEKLDLSLIKAARDVINSSSVQFILVNYHYLPINLFQFASLLTQELDL